MIIFFCFYGEKFQLDWWDIVSHKRLIINFVTDTSFKHVLLCIFHSNKWDQCFYVGIFPNLHELPCKFTKIWSSTPTRQIYVLKTSWRRPQKRPNVLRTPLHGPIRQGMHRDVPKKCSGRQFNHSNKMAFYRIFSIFPDTCI